MGMEKTPTMKDALGAGTAAGVVGQRLSLRLGKVYCPGMVIAYFPKTQKHRIRLQGTDGSSREKNFRLTQLEYTFTKEKEVSPPSSAPLAYDRAVRRDAEGRRLEIYHQVRNKWYQGTILRYVEHCQQHSLMLEPQGKVHLVDLSQQVWRFTDLIREQQQQQQQTSEEPQGMSLATSRYMGVERLTVNSWKCCYTAEQLYIGCFGTEKDAALAYDVYARKRGTSVNFEDRRICRKHIKQLMVPEPKEPDCVVSKEDAAPEATPPSSADVTPVPASKVVTIRVASPEPEAVISSPFRDSEVTRNSPNRVVTSTEAPSSSDEVPPALLEEKHLLDDSQSEATTLVGAASMEEDGGCDLESQPVPPVSRKEKKKKEKKAKKQSQSALATKEKKVQQKPSMIDMIDDEDADSSVAATSKPRRRISLEDEEDDDDSVVAAPVTSAKKSTKKTASVEDDDSVVAAPVTSAKKSTKKTARSVEDDDSECEFDLANDELEEESYCSSSSSSSDEEEEEEVVRPRKRVASHKEKKRAKPSANLFEDSEEEDDEEERDIAYRMNKKGRQRALQEIGDFNTPPKDNESKRKRTAYPIGTRFLKEFPGYGTFEGHVTMWDGQSYHVYYPEDGDKEEFGPKEMSKYEIVFVPKEFSEMDASERKMKKKRRKQVYIE